MLTFDTPIDKLIRTKDTVKKGLATLRIHTVRDLLYHFPNRYADASSFASIGSLTEGDEKTVRATITKLSSRKGWKSKIAMTEATIEDTSGTMHVVWFHQPYFAKMLGVGQTIELSGKVTLYKGAPTLTNPTLRNEKTLPIDAQDMLFARGATGTLTPLYPETKGVSSEWLRHAIHRALLEIDTVPEHLPETVLKSYSLPTLKTALIWIHEPRTHDDAQKARKRFAFDEIFLIQLTRQKERALIAQTHSYNIALDTKAVATFIQRFPYTLTTAQQTALDQIMNDITKGHPMSRLLEGDVGSGKTAVAAITTYATVTNRPQTNGKTQSFGNLQVAYMAPTEILAKQHFASFIELFRGTGIQLALLTGSGAKKFPSKVNPNTSTDISKAQLKKWIANGEIPIVIGTHALIQKTLSFKHLALVIIDEQHRFGLAQRQALAHKERDGVFHMPHLLSMSATPIPRTLALTIYGDLDLSVLDAMPAGRKWPRTTIVAPDARDATYKQLHLELQAGRQIYIICPRIAHTDKEGSFNVRSVTEEAKRLQKDIFPMYRIATLHSKMTAREKDTVMQAFVDGHTQILVATSVVEVGVNVPNATVMIIEGAERFGLSQLHQLRGRIMRSSHQPHCYLFAEIKSDRTLERLTHFVNAQSGFELAEYDLMLRGAGELTGTSQWGISDIGMEALRNPKLVEAARESAQILIAEDSSFNNHPLLARKLDTLQTIHLE